MASCQKPTKVSDYTLILKRSTTNPMFYIPKDDIYFFISYLE